MITVWYLKYLWYGPRLKSIHPDYGHDQADFVLDSHATVSMVSESSHKVGLLTKSNEVTIIQPWIVINIISQTL